MKPVKYFAVRVGNGVTIRRTVKGLQRVKSSLYRPGSEFALVQVSWSGGKVIGGLSYNEIIKRLNVQINDNGCVKLTPESVKALRPFMIKGE